VRPGGGRRRGIGRGLPRGQRRLQPVDGVLGVLDEPVDGLAGAVVAQPVLHVVELDGGVRRQAHAPVPRPACRAHLAVAFLAPRGAHDVTSLHRHDLPAAAPHARARRGRRGHGLAARAHRSPSSRLRVGRRLRRELVRVVLAGSPEGQELRLEAVVLGVGLASVAHGGEKGILSGQQAAPLPHGRRRRGLQVLELEEGGQRRVLVLLQLLVELQQPVVVPPPLICVLLRSASFSAAAAVRSPMVEPRIQTPRLLGRRCYRCSASGNALLSTSAEPIARTAGKTVKKSGEEVSGGCRGMGTDEGWRADKVVGRDREGWTLTQARRRGQEWRPG
jgi:hypothetical protein